MCWFWSLLAASISLLSVLSLAYISSLLSGCNIKTMLFQTACEKICFLQGRKWWNTINTNSKMPICSSWNGPHRIIIILKKIQNIQISNCAAPFHFLSTWNGALVDSLSVEYALYLHKRQKQQQIWIISEDHFPLVFEKKTMEKALEELAESSSRGSWNLWSGNSIYLNDWSSSKSFPSPCMGC